MKRIFLFFLLFLSLFFALLASAQHRGVRFRCVEYNCENLFDTLHDVGKDDVEFLPDGSHTWTSSRYWHKQASIARILLDIGGLQPVDIVGLCEVENDTVITHLIRRTRLAALDYEYVMTDSRDLRGIDVALLYQPYTFRLVGKRSYSVSYDAEKERPTRDILHCTGIIPSGDTLDVVVAHFPSRRGGAYLTEDYRLRAAGVVRHVTDSLQLVRQKAAIIVMGDCNDEPSDRSIQYIVDGGFRNVSANAQAVGSGNHARRLHEVKGTYYYQRAWSRIDNILVNHAAAKRYGVGDAVIFAPEYLLEPDADGFLFPYRLYRGPSYHGGVSDHLPLGVDLWY